MGGNPPAPNGPEQSVLSGPRCRTDGAGDGLFELTERPVIEYAQIADGPAVSRVNPAFTEQFAADGDVGSELAALLSAIVVSETDGRSLPTQLAEGTDRAVTRRCETADGLEPFRIETIPHDDGGYVVFTEVMSDSQVSILDYLTHSLRNPLEVAIIHTEVASETEEFDYLETVRSAHDRMEAIITDAHRLARRGAVVAEPESVEVADVAGEAWETVKTAATTLEIDSPGTVLADERGLRVLFENLFRNAVHHGTPDRRAAGDEMAVTVRSIPGGFAVADDGCGIPEDERDQVLDVGYTTNEDGTGLGLPIVVDIAEGHGWTVDVTESPTGGTQFEFTDTTGSDP